MASVEGDVLNPVPGDPKPFALDRSARDEIALFLAEAALAAGPAVMEEYERGCDARSKEDGSPVTSADHRAEAIICDHLARMAPSHADLRRRVDRGRSADQRCRAIPAWWIRSTGRGNSWRETANSRSTWR